MNECFFCGSTENTLSEEHVWPKWVSRLLLGRHGSDHFRHLRATGSNTTANWRSRELDITTTTVCAPCNNGWLSVLENEQIKPLASRLILGADAVVLTPDSQSAMAAWAYKMAMLVDVANPDMRAVFFTPGERLMFRQTTLAHPFVRVFLSRYDCGHRPAHALTPCHTVTVSGRLAFYVKVSTVTAGYLGMQVMSVRSAESNALVPASEMEFRFLGTAKKAIIPMWPTVPEVLSWPPAHTMSHQDIEDWTAMWGSPGKSSQPGRTSSDEPGES